MDSIENIYSDSFDDKHPELKELMLGYGKTREFAKGDFIIEEGKPSEGFYWVLEGGAKVCIQTNQKNEQIVTLLSVADFVGISAVMNNHTFNKSAKVLSDKAKVLFIGKNDFMEFMQKSPLVVIPLLKHIESKIDRIESRAAQIMRKTIEQRLAYAFLLLQIKFGCDEKGYIRFPFSPKDLANFVGTTRTTVYRVLRKFQDANLLNADQKRIKILESNQLQKLFNSELEIA